MASKISIKSFGSKNIAKQIINLQKKNNFSLIEKILLSPEFKNLLPKILHILKVTHKKSEEFENEKIYSKTYLDDDTIKNLKDKLNLKDPQIIIDNQMRAGVKIRTNGKLIDATFTTMLEQALKKI